MFYPSLLYIHQLVLIPRISVMLLAGLRLQIIIDLSFSTAFGALILSKRELDGLNN